MTCADCGHRVPLHVEECDRCALVAKQAPWLVGWVKDVVRTAIESHETVHVHERLEIDE